MNLSLKIKLRWSPVPRPVLALQLHELMPKRALPLC
jgi:hypothetical protein